MRDGRRMSSVVGMSHPQSYEILLLPEPDDTATGAPAPAVAIRSAVVAATGETGASGYPRYAGDGMEADIDPASHTVEALLVDGAELDYGLTVRIAERIGGTQEPERTGGGSTDAASAAGPVGASTDAPGTVSGAAPGTVSGAAGQSRRGAPGPAGEGTPGSGSTGGSAPDRSAGG